MLPLSVNVLDVRHGLCVAMRSPRRSFIYDCGNHQRYRHAIAGPALEVEACFSPAIDTIALSHLHYDHYSGFLQPRLRHLQDVRRVLLALSLIHI